MLMWNHDTHVSENEDSGKMTDTITIKIKKTTAEKIRKHGKMGESYDDVINMLIREKL